jgi:hypothetical protein
VAYRDPLDSLDYSVDNRRRYSPRHRIPHRSPPRVCNYFVLYSPREYAQVLDCLYEMTDAVATANGIPHAEALEQTMRAEGWEKIKPTDKRALLARLTQECAT